MVHGAPLALSSNLRERIGSRRNMVRSFKAYFFSNAHSRADGPGPFAAVYSPMNFAMSVNTFCP